MQRKVKAFQENSVFLQEKVKHHERTELKAIIEECERQIKYHLSSIITLQTCLKVPEKIVQQELNELQTIV